MDTVSGSAGPGAKPLVSLCATLFNEAESVTGWLESIQQQTRAPDEVVLVDAGSRDGTIEAIEQAARGDGRIRLAVVAGCNVPEGRNEAIRRAQGDIVAITDAGTLLEPDWLERLIRPLADDPTTAVASGFFRPYGATFFEHVLATVITPRLYEIDPDLFLPSSRSVAFRKEWWTRVGGYPEWLRAGEDLVFDFALKAEGARFAFVSDAIVRWRPRSSLKEFFDQYRHYARGDGHGHLWPKRHAVRYLAYALGLVLVLVAFVQPLVVALLGVGGAAYMRKFWRRIRDERPGGGGWRLLAAYVLAPLIVVIGDVGKMIGYPQGLWERRRAGGPAGLKAARIRSHRAV